MILWSRCTGTYASTWNLSLIHISGNVRELRQKVMGAVLQAQEGVVMKEHLELTVTKPTSTVSFALRNDAEDKERILRALKQANMP